MKLIIQVDPPVRIAGTDRNLNTIEFDISVFQLVWYGLKTALAALFYGSLFVNHAIIWTIRSPMPEQVSHQGDTKEK
jgi:hypothetical protein